MDNQHKKITGYRDLSEDEINVMNRIKEAGQQLELLLEAIDADPKVSADPRWVAIGRTDLQTGIMALVRSVAKPESF